MGVTSPYVQIIAVCLVVFLVYWTWSARHIRPAKRSESATSALISNTFNWVGFALLSLGSLRRAPLAYLSLSASSARAAMGTACVVIGVTIAIWARAVLGANWSRMARIGEGQELITGGPYRVVRNPIYSGMLLGAFGVALAAGRLVALVGLVFVFASLWRKSIVEERLLASEFGERYLAYARRVKRMIPFVL